MFVEFNLLPVPDFAALSLTGNILDLPTSVNSKVDCTIEDLDSSFSSTTSVGTITTAMWTMLSHDFFTLSCITLSSTVILNIIL